MSLLELSSTRTKEWLYLQQTDTQVGSESIPVTVDEIIGKHLNN